MSNDALERLKKRQRPSVPTRDASLTTSIPDTSTPRNQEANQASSNLDTSKSEHQQTSQLANDVDNVSPDISTPRYQDNQKVSSILDTSIPGYQDTNQSRIEPELWKTKQSTLRLEVGLSKRLSEVCQANGLSREVLIEALFEHYEANPNLHQEILAQAQKKASHRLQVANLKRAQSMMERFK